MYITLKFVDVDGTQEAEGKDKTSLLLPGTQQAMVSFQWKNPDLVFRNPDFLLKYVDYTSKQR